MSNDEMKSFASFEIALKASSSKSKSALVMLANVSASFSPMNGDNPDNLVLTKSAKSLKQVLVGVQVFKVLI